MIKQSILCSLLLLVPFLAYTDDKLERFESVSEELNLLLYKAMISDAASEGADASTLMALIPDTNWDAPMREAGSCMLDKFEDIIGNSGIEDMLDELEALLPKIRNGGMKAFEEASELTSGGLSDEQSIKINRECGMIELQQKAMMESEFMQELFKSTAAQ